MKTVNQTMQEMCEYITDLKATTNAIRFVCGCIVIYDTGDILFLAPKNSLDITALAYVYNGTILSYHHLNAKWLDDEEEYKAFLSDYSVVTLKIIKKIDRNKFIEKFGLEYSVNKLRKHICKKLL